MILKYNLQFFAKDGPGGEKTELPTQKKLEDARKEGQVAKSKEIGNGLGLITLFIVLKIFIGMISNHLLDSFSMVYNKIPDYVTLVTGGISRSDLSIMNRAVMGKMLVILLPLFLIGVVVAFVGDLIQVKWKPTSKPLKPKGSKMNPINGLKKMFSKEAIIELIKAFLKIILILVVTYQTLSKEWQAIYLLYDMPLEQAILLIGNITIDLGLKIAIIYMIIAFADFMYQKYKFRNDMKMTKQEVKEEYKNSEGNPEIKGKIRQKMREISQRRMMQNLPKADVIITNPTHYAVAIQYDPAVSDAPIVIAKGEDYLAQKIKAVAKEHRIEIVENKPLARMLYANVEVGSRIPPELFQAVAEVLAYV